MEQLTFDGTPDVPRCRGRSKNRIDDEGRECCVCHVYKPWSEYYELVRAGVRGHRPDCKPCRRARVRRESSPEVRRRTAIAWRKANPERYREGQIRQAAKRRGLDPDMVIAHFRSHSGACDICGGSPGAGDQRNGRLCIDHDHLTGAFRGLLCSNCNIALGKFKDSIESLSAAIAYLRQASTMKESA